MVKAMDYAPAMNEIDAACSAFAQQENLPGLLAGVVRGGELAHVTAFGQADRARTSANYREILDAMWLFNAKFEQARLKFDEIRAR